MVLTMQYFGIFVVQVNLEGGHQLNRRESAGLYHSYGLNQYRWGTRNRFYGREGNCKC